MWFVYPNVGWVVHIYKVSLLCLVPYCGHTSTVSKPKLVFKSFSIYVLPSQKRPHVITLIEELLYVAQYFSILESVRDDSSSWTCQIVFFSYSEMVHVDSNVYRNIAISVKFIELHWPTVKEFLGIWECLANNQLIKLRFRSVCSSSAGVLVLFQNSGDSDDGTGMLQHAGAWKLVHIWQSCPTSSQQDYSSIP